MNVSKIYRYSLSYVALGAVAVALFVSLRSPSPQLSGPSAPGFPAETLASDAAREPIRDPWPSLVESWLNSTLSERPKVVAKFLGETSFANLQILFSTAPLRLSGDDLLPLQLELLEQISVHGFLTTANLANLIPQSANRDTVRLHLALDWAEGNLVATCAWLDKWSSQPAREVAASEIGYILANSDSSTVSRLFAGWNIKTSPTGRLVLAALISQGGASEHFDLCLQLARQLPAAPEREKTLAKLSGEWSRRDLDSARAYAETLRRGQEEFTIALTNHWLGQSPHEALSWAATLSNAHSRSKVLNSAFARWASFDPVAAASFVNMNLATSVDRPEVIVSISSAWASQDSMAAAAWLASLPPEQVSTYAIKNVAFQWKLEEPEELFNWLGNLDTAFDRDAALQANASRLLDQDPDLAVEWFSLIGDETLRRSQITRAVERWLEFDPISAERWLQQSEIANAFLANEPDPGDSF